MRIEKKYLVDSIVNAVKDSDFVYFVSFAGLTVKSFSDLRNQLADQGAVCRVMKNTLIKKAAEQLELSGVEAIDLTASTAMVFGNGIDQSIYRAIVAWKIAMFP